MHMQRDRVRAPTRGIGDSECVSNLRGHFRIATIARTIATTARTPTATSTFLAETTFAPNRSVTASARSMMPSVSSDVRSSNIRQGVRMHGSLPMFHVKRE